ncbi:MAG: Pilus assembly protein, PilO [Pelotomaculum sp. PtaB.Bin013]|uniref:Type 4a pilus biogenesis protein PilO n=1 Tax=Pelotomaculum isophthalicicum JI TaxID=947010 RepID=A0A9X4GZC7_9FIRM|nr:type 4a pilus biogenesis protein PilO [Pelotomaculum isophthalicicum]MDF9408617.1 type 4a pilus biogenesis protein PilO [Pelotomaculum isophthalicicum JI]OPX87099.1 MAG: Pilus assembly protein, PilO [Pelotomaculum sp. PtaB.Bin013]
MRQELQSGRRTILLVLGIVVLCLVFIKYVFMPQYHRQCENNDRIADLRSKYRAAVAAAESLQRETELAGKVTDQLNEYKVLFNNVMDDGMAFVYIALKAMEAQVEIVSVVPAAVHDKGTYLEYPVKFEVRGGYHEVCSFIREIESFPNLTEIRMFKITGYDNNMIRLPDAAQKKQKAMGEELLKIPPAKYGEVMATLDIVTYSCPSPVAGMHMEQITNWAVGRDNAFLMSAIRNKN